MNIRSTLMILSTCLISVMSQASTNITDNDSQHLLVQLIETAISNDKKQEEITAQADAILENSIEAASLPDPKIKIGFGNLPIESLSFNDDPMTMASISLMQQFDRGSTLTLQQKKGEIQAASVKLQLDVRKLDIASAMTQRWIELSFLQQVANIIEQNLRLFTELSQVTTKNYAIGISETQDVLQAKLKLVKIDEELSRNQQQQQAIIDQLSEWLGSQWLNKIDNLDASQVLPWQALTPLFIKLKDQQQHYNLLAQHPLVKISDTVITSNENQLSIATEAYKPQWGIEIMYGARFSEKMNGKPASDTLSAYLTMDLPLFSKNKQDHSYSAAQYQIVAAKSQRDLLLQQMSAKLNSLINQRQHLSSRLKRYHQSILPQTKDRTQAVWRGYKNNTSSFQDVINAADQELDLATEYARIKTDIQLTNNQLAALVNAFDIPALRNHQQTTTAINNK